VVKFLIYQINEKDCLWMSGKSLENTGERFIPELFDKLTADEHWQRYISVGSFVKN
jgi:hypothetical protein